MGLNSKYSQGSSRTFDLLKFASIRGYITKEELVAYSKKSADKEAQEKERLDEIEKKYIEKYGEDASKWPKGVEDMMDDEMFPDPCIEEKYGP